MKLLLSFICIIGFLSPEFSEAKGRTFRTFANRLVKVERLTVHSLRENLVESALSLNKSGFFLKLLSPKSVVLHSEKFKDGASLRFVLYKRKSRLNVYLNEQSERVYLRIEMKGMDYRYAGELRQKLPHTVYFDEVTDDGLVTVAESDIFKNILREDQALFQLRHASDVLHSLYIAATRKHGLIENVIKSQTKVDGTLPRGVTPIPAGP
jgi:hypothetical protein